MSTDCPRSSDSFRTHETWPLDLVAEAVARQWALEKDQDRHYFLIHGMIVGRLFGDAGGIQAK